MQNHIVHSSRRVQLIFLSLACCVVLGLLFYQRVFVSHVKTYRQSQILLDTVVDLIAASSDEAQAQKAISAAYAEMRRLEELLSKYRTESQIYAINQGAGQHFVPLDDEVQALIQRSLQYSVLTDGLFDITIGALVELWGIDTEHERIPADTEIQQILPSINYKHIQIEKDKGVYLRHPQTALDLGGIAKGYSIDRAIEILQIHNIESVLLNAGGDIRSIGSKPDGTPWRIGIKHPRKEGILGVVELHNAAIATSGDYERYFTHEGTRYHHLLDPRTGRPVRQCQSATILAQTAEIADVLATAVFIMGPIQGLAFIEEQADIEGMIVRADGEILLSSGFSFQPK